jgi:hypothetical protein
MAPQVITRDDLVSLIERLSARGRSRVGTDTTSVKADIVFATRRQIDSKMASKRGRPGTAAGSKRLTENRYLMRQGLASQAGPFSLPDRRAEQPKSPACDGLAHSPYLTRRIYVLILFTCLSRPWEKLGNLAGVCESAASLQGQCLRTMTARASCAKPALTLI